VVSFWQAVEVAAQAQNMLTGRTAIGKQGHYKRVVADLDKHLPAAEFESLGPPQEKVVASGKCCTGPCW
jgi:DNA transposition AAA+ family ATPase